MEILYESRALVVCVKPVGADAEHDMVKLLTGALGGTFFPVHRLDRNVGGVMVYARTREAAAALSRAMAQGDFIKEYVAQVHGTPPPRGDWTDYLFKDRRKNKVYTVKRMRAGVRQARLEYRLVSSGAVSTVHIRLHTGRSHQIRVQFASRGYPLAGDRKYGARDGDGAPALYACRITLPIDAKARTFEHYPDWFCGEVGKFV